MTCRELLSAIDPYLDGELSVFEILRVHGHLLACNGCQKVLESEAALHSLLRNEALEEGPPPGLRSRVVDRLGAAYSGRRFSQSRPPRFPGIRVVLAVVTVAALLLATRLASQFWWPPDVPPFGLEVAAKHRLYTEASSPAVEMASSDVARLTEWLERHVGFPVKAPGLERPEHRLVGGRVSSVADTPAAYLLYEWYGRPLSLFITAPQPRSRPEGAERIVDGVELYTATLPGVSLLWWEDSARLYTAVSPGPVAGLQEFAVLCVRARPRTSAPEPSRAALRG
jgi:anti-sigma factor (TIGR02949 family)